MSSLRRVEPTATAVAAAVPDALSGSRPIVVLPADPAARRLVTSGVRPEDDDSDDPAGLAAVVATSGSTGEPKGVRLTGEALVNSAEATHARLGGPGQWLLAMPPSAVAGLQVCVRSHLAGHPVVPHGGDWAADLVGFTASRRYAAIVPTQLRRILDEPAATAALRAYDAVLVGAASTPPSLRARAEAAGIAVVTTYGMTETCGGCVYDGCPLDGVDVRIAADSGRIELAGPMLASGYRFRPDLDDVFADGWFATSDRGALVDGVLSVLGRTDDVVVSGGVNVGLDAVGRRVAELVGVTDAVAVGVPDARWGTRVVAVVVCDGPLALCGDDELRTLVREYVSAELPRAWAPQQVVRRDALPLLGSGKVDRLRLADECARVSS